MGEQNYEQRLEMFLSNLSQKLEIHRQEKQQRLERFLSNLSQKLENHQGKKRQRLEKFLSGLSQKLENHRKEKQQRDRLHSTDFNVVSEFIRPDENRLSDIIACLLDTNGTHGQQGKFLDAFIRRLFKENQPNRVAELSREQPEVKREDPTHDNDENQHRWIDITVGFEGFGIGIENKPWAGEGDGQLRDYYKHLQRKYKQEFCLVFITPNGRKPTSIDNPDDLIDVGELYCLSYSSDILEWIEECWQLCESDRFCGFLSDFSEYIRGEFTTEENDDANE